jgi:hypothetical protein
MAAVSRTDILSSDTAISWRAVAAGAAAALALTLVLLAIGSAVGFSSVSPWANSGVSATTFEIGSGIYLVVMAMISSTIGGYIAGRLRTKWTGLHNYEVQFRDTAHGFLAWAVATILGAAFLASASTFLAAGVATGASSGAGAAAGAQRNNTSAYTVGQLFRPAAGGSAASSASSAGATAPAGAAGAAGAAGGGTNAGSGGVPNANRQAFVILTHSAANGGTLPDTDRTYLAQLVASQTGTSQADAEKRVDQVMAQAKAAADKARKAAAALSIWLAISMLAGAFSAALAAIEGGQLRDRRWRGVFGTRAYTEARIDN